MGVELTWSAGPGRAGSGRVGRVTPHFRERCVSQRADSLLLRKGALNNLGGQRIPAVAACSTCQGARSFPTSSPQLPSLLPRPIAQGSAAGSSEEPAGSGFRADSTSGRASKSLRDSPLQRFAAGSLKGPRSPVGPLPGCTASLLYQRSRPRSRFRMDVASPRVRGCPSAAGRLHTSMS